MKSLPKYDWLKGKGYLHLTPKIDISKDYQEIIAKVKNPNFVSTYAFFPLLHSVIKERRYKKGAPTDSKRSHSSWQEGVKKKHVKQRPLHYATHMDSLIFGYYADLLYRLYEEKLKRLEGVTDCVLAYRKIPIPGEKKNKGTIHFAKEVFDEIVNHASPSCVVLKFDIKSFFNQMDHTRLKYSWNELLGIEGKLPSDHYAVFKASTRFSYILRDDLRLKYANQFKNRRKGFDEKKLSRLRNHFGKECFFESAQEFRESIKSKKIRIHKHPFRNENGALIGIPQGLPISAVLANLYLLDFDKKMYEYIVKERGGVYRRYSDDMIVICKPEEVEEISRNLIKEIEENKVELSKDKTEVFLFKSFIQTDGRPVLKSVKFFENKSHIGFPFSYLGFEFYGYKTLIKSGNLAKFYRRMITATKRKSRRAVETFKRDPNKIPVIFHRQLYKLYTLISLTQTKLRIRTKKLELQDTGRYSLKTKVIPNKYQSNYLSYVRRASAIMNDLSIKRQLRHHKKILHSAINKHINCELNKETL